MTASVGTRLAGEALKSFHTVGTGLLGEKIAEKAIPVIGATASKFLAPAAELTASGAVMGAENLLGLTGGQQQSNYKVPVGSTNFSTQQYIPGISPLTNEQAGALYLEQVRLQNQMQLIQARQTASSPQSYYTGSEDLAVPFSQAYSRKYI